MIARPLRPDERALLPKAADIAFYEEHGYWISPPCLSAEIVEMLSYGTERYYAGERDAPLLLELETDWNESQGNVLRQNDYVSLQVDEFRALLAEPLIFAMAAMLSRSPSVRLFHDQLVYKPAGASERDTVVGWHTDRAYWGTCTSTSMISCWIPLQDCTEDMGPMVVLDGSHTWAEDDLRTFHDRNLAELEGRVARPGRPFRAVPMTLAAGQVSFHHCRTVHGSLANRSRVPRIAWAIHLQDEANRYRPSRGRDGQPEVHFNDLLCRKSTSGEPDYADPAICPTLYREHEEPVSTP